MTEDVPMEPPDEPAVDAPPPRHEVAAPVEAASASPEVVVGPAIEPLPTVDVSQPPPWAGRKKPEEPPTVDVAESAAVETEGTQSGEERSIPAEPAGDELATADFVGEVSTPVDDSVRLDDEAVVATEDPPAGHEPAVTDVPADDHPSALEPVVSEAPIVVAPAAVEDGDDGELTWDAIALALASEAPIPPALLAGAPSEEEPPAAVDEQVSGEVGEVEVADDFPPESPDAEDLLPDEVAEFWDPPESVAEDDDEDVDELVSDPWEPSEVLEPLEAEPWPDEDGVGVAGLKGLDTDWREADTQKPAPPGSPTGGRAGPRRRAGKPAGRAADARPSRSRLVGLLAGRWSALRTGERVNFVLYALTGVSILAMGLELLAGPDALPTDVTTTPAPAVSPTTVRQSTTITFTIPTTTPEEVAAAPPPVRSSPGPAAAASPATTPEPDPDPEPTPTTGSPGTTAPPTTRPTPTTARGFPEPTPPVLPTFPGPPITSVTVPEITVPSTPGP